VIVLHVSLRGGWFDVSSGTDAKYSRSIRRSQETIWFQLALFWSTNSKLLILKS